MKIYSTRGVSTMQAKTEKFEGLAIKIARLRSGMRQYELATKLGIPQGRLSEMESGRREIPPEILQQIDEILGGISQ